MATLPALVAALPRARGGLRTYLELSKVRLSAMVVLTAAVGFLLAAPGPIHWPRAMALVAGTMLAAFSANALNQWWESQRDARMHRTAQRPLPSGRLSTGQSLLWAGGVGASGLAALAWVGPLAAALGLFNIGFYVLIYTPLKPRSVANTLAGAVVGAVPPMMGWAAASGGLDAGAWALGAILFLWQVPHFLALAWMYREDYRRGGFRMLSSADATGALTARISLIYCLALAPASLSITALGLAGWPYALGALLLSAWLTALALRFAQRRDHASALRLFLASVTYLPLLLALMTLDHLAGAR